MNNRTIPLSVLTALALTGCGTPAGQTSIAQQNENPLTASRYGDELADTLANIIIIQNMSGSIKGDRKAKIESMIQKAKVISAQAHEMERGGMMGAILSHKEAVTGYGLYINDTLFFSSDFEVNPGINLHVYLTTVVDPRDVIFPDAESIDLGEIQSAYGAQQYAVPVQKHPELYRTLVLWDKDLQRLFGFAQLSKSN